MIASVALTESTQLVECRFTARNPQNKNQACHHLLRRKCPEGALRQSRDWFRSSEVLICALELCACCVYFHSCSYLVRTLFFSAQAEYVGWCSLLVEWLRKPQKILLCKSAGWTTAAKQRQREHKRHQPASNPWARREPNKRTLDYTWDKQLLQHQWTPAHDENSQHARLEWLSHNVSPDAGIYGSPRHDVSSHPGSGLLSVSNVTGDVMRLTLSFRISSSVKKPNPISSTAWRITVLSCDMPPNGFYCSAAAAVPPRSPTH